MAEESAQKAHLTVRVSADALAKLQQMAKEQDRSVSYLVDKAVVEFVERHRAKGGRK
jgi:predicted transcriptional regulator